MVAEDELRRLDNKTVQQIYMFTGTCVVLYVVRSKSQMSLYG